MIQTEIRDGVGRMTLARPEKHNAINNRMLVEMSETWRAWANDDGVRAVIVTGAGSKAFCSGGDLANTIPMLTGARAPDDEWDRRVLADATTENTAMLRWAFPKPVIAAVNGVCLAGGFELLNATDIRIAAEHAEFGLPEASLGLVPSMGSIARLPRQIPWAVAMEILLAGRRLSADEAKHYGIVNHVTPADQLMSKAEEVAQAIVRGGPLAVRKIKEVALAASGRSLDDAFKLEDAGFAEIMRTQDAREGPLAFLEKRAPRFTGK